MFLFPFEPEEAEDVADQSKRVHRDVMNSDESERDAEDAEREEQHRRTSNDGEHCPHDEI